MKDLYNIVLIMLEGVTYPVSTKSCACRHQRTNRRHYSDWPGSRLFVRPFFACVFHSTGNCLTTWFYRFSQAKRHLWRLTQLCVAVGSCLLFRLWLLAMDIVRSWCLYHPGRTARTNYGCIAGTGHLRVSIYGKPAATTALPTGISRRWTAISEPTSTIPTRILRVSAACPTSV